MNVSRDYSYNGTGLAKVAPILVASVALLVPSNNFEIPRSMNSFDYGATERSCLIRFGIIEQDEGFGS
jgi:hypothetical protein